MLWLDDELSLSMERFRYHVFRIIIGCESVSATIKRSLVLLFRTPDILTLSYDLAATTSMLAYAEVISEQRLSPRTSCYLPLCLRATKDLQSPDYSSPGRRRIYAGRGGMNSRHLFFFTSGPGASVAMAEQKST